MRSLSELINDLVGKKMQIEQFKKDHPEQSEIVQLVEDYATLFSEACSQIQTPTQSVIYPIYWLYSNPLIPPYQITCADHTTMLG